MELLTPEIRAQLLANGQKRAQGIEHDPYPVVKLFTPDAGATWLLTELDPANPDVAFGLCDVGLGTPELGSVSLTELASSHGKLGLSIERDIDFRADRALSRYAAAARKTGVIIA
jgi:hypothetical protein